MPNYCDYTMKITGRKKNCEEFVKRLRSRDEPNHFWRIFEADVYDEDTDGVSASFFICGYCAWSLETCCRSSGYSDGVDLFEVNTKELFLKMEAYSREPGCCFEEHYIYDNGICIADECLDINVYYWDRNEFPNYKDFKEEYPDAPPESEFTSDEDVVVGGFGSEYCYWHI